MRIAYWDCFSGIAGDMVLGALVGCGLDPDDLRRDLSGLALDGWEIEHRVVQVGALAADDVRVLVGGAPVEEHGHDGPGGDHDHGHEHPHRGLAEIREILEGSDLPDGVAGRALAAFTALCEAEASVHGTTVEEVHLHDVGAIDAIVDVVGACAGIRRLGIERIVCSSLNVGGGEVETAHGVLPVPAPATAFLLRDAPTHSSGPRAELVTPTGAALVSTLVDEFGGWPPMVPESIGYGAGDRRFDDRPNVFRMVVGDDRAATTGHDGEVHLIETNIDDMDPQLFGSLIPNLIDAGALDAFITAVTMKKGRPGHQLTVLVGADRVDQIADLVFRETTTIGLRTWPVGRRELERRHESVQTRWGTVRVKLAVLGDETVNVAPEFDDCEALAAEHGVPVKDVFRAAIAAHEGKDP